MFIKSMPERGNLYSSFAFKVKVPLPMFKWFCRNQMRKAQTSSFQDLNQQIMFLKSTVKVLMATVSFLSAQKY
ncbi:hypothetical protein BDFB_000769 [Asbolus verrucosus]|uniref:Uncharacterized protein n=1 Tax=Asbolus verrucosus TaxID=1661398 RepID=A0A482VIZ8_ASBVE|nr:hypothetical protein BDFB_000769 [Asbolus verrucosus]